MYWIVGIIAGVIVAGYLVYKFLLGNSVYSKMYTDEHFIEFAQGVLKVKSQAINNATNPDGQGFTTSIGIRLMYTISHEDNVYRHHFSMSCDKEALARNAASDLVGYLLNLLQLKEQKFEFARSNNGVYHLLIDLDEDTHQKYSAKKVIVPDESQVASMISDCIAQRSRYMNVLTSMKVNFFEMGTLHYQKGDTPSALRYFQKAIEADPSSIPPYFALAQIGHELGMEEANSFLAKGLELCAEKGIDPKEFGIDIKMEEK